MRWQDTGSGSMGKIISIPASDRPCPIQDLQLFTVVDYPGHVACTLFTAGCNLRCPYCHNADLIAPDDLPRIDETHLLEFLKERKGLLTGVCITGGEPTLHELAPLLELIKHLGYNIKLDTNGTRPKRWIPWVQEGLIDYVAMDVKVPLEKYGHMGATETDKEGVAQSAAFLLSNPDFSYEFRATIHPNWFSRDDVKRIGQWLAGAKRLALQPFTPSEKVLAPDLCRGLGYSKKSLLEFKNILQNTIYEVSVRG